MDIQFHSSWKKARPFKSKVTTSFIPGKVMYTCHLWEPLMVPHIEKGSQSQTPFLLHTPIG
jgi:hypothetical protein